MMKIIRNILFTSICLCVLTGVTMHIRAAEPEPLKVGPGQTYATLNAALEYATDGQLIQIIGSVTETNPADPVLIDKRVIIQGDVQGGVSSTYTVRNWTKTDSPFQITAPGVTIQNLSIVINGAATTCSPIEITGSNLSLKRTSITLTGTAATVFSPITVSASGLTMEEVTIPGTARAPVLVDLQGNSATLKDVSITAAANTTGLYSATSPANLVLDTCSFAATASTATLVSLPTPDGLTLTGCTFSFTLSGGSGLQFTQASAAAATKTLTATGCVFNLNALATAVHLNGYHGVFEGCEFNYSKGGTAILSQTHSNADYTFRNCGFYMGKNSGEKAASAKGLVLQNNEQGSIVLDGCTLVASCAPDAAIATGASLAHIINASDSALRSLTIHNSSIALNAGAQNATGISANAEYVTITNSSFKTNAKTAKCVVVNGTALATVTGNTFDIAQAAAEGLRFTDAVIVSLKSNAYHLSTSGTGTAVTNTVPAASVVVSEQNAVNLQGQASQGLLIENVSKLDVRNGTTIKSVESKSAVGIRANQVKEIEIDGLQMDFNGATHGVIVDGTKFPQGSEGSVRITNTTSKLSGGASRPISITFANGVLIDRYHGVCDDTAASSVALNFLSTTGVNISNSAFELHGSSTGINVSAMVSGAEPLDENGVPKQYRSGGYEIHNNNFYLYNKSKALFFGGKNTPDVDIHHNLMQADHAGNIVTVGYGRNQAVHHNVIESVNSAMAIVSDGVDETAAFSMDADSDIYVDGGIVDAYRNQFYSNQLKGSFERGFYISNNGDVIRDNDLSEATFQYESVPGTIRNSQVLAAYCKDVMVLNNRFVQARAPDVPVIHIYNAVLSEVTGNAARLVTGAPEVLFAQGSYAIAPNGVKYPERIAAHDATNTVDGITPIEFVREWSDPGNLMYEYILRLPKYPYTVAYYNDFVSDENLLAVEQGYSDFAEGHVLTFREVSADLGEDWLSFYRPADHAGDIASNIGDLTIRSNAAENVVVVIYLPIPSTVTEPEPGYVQPSVQRRAATAEPAEIYTEIDETEVPLDLPAPTNPNPQMGKTGTLLLFIGGILSVLIAVPAFCARRKRKQ